MAQKVIATLIDDLDGGEAEETVTFGLDGVSYDIDLSGQNAEQLRGALAGYVENARRIGGRRKLRVPAASPKSSQGLDLVQVREWARAHGYDVSDRGRVANHIIEAFKQSLTDQGDNEARTPKRSRAKQPGAKRPRFKA